MEFPTISHRSESVNVHKNLFPTISNNSDNTTNNTNVRLGGVLGWNIIAVIAMMCKLLNGADKGGLTMLSAPLSGIKVGSAAKRGIGLPVTYIPTLINPVYNNLCDNVRTET